jgi:hypothetical protein
MQRYASVLERDFLPMLDSTERTLLAQVGKPWRAAVGPLYKLNPVDPLLETARFQPLSL